MEWLFIHSTNLRVSLTTRALHGPLAPSQFPPNTWGGGTGSRKARPWPQSHNTAGPHIRGSRRSIWSRLPAPGASSARVREKVLALTHLLWSLNAFCSFFPLLHDRTSGDRSVGGRKGRAGVGDRRAPKGEGASGVCAGRPQTGLQDPLRRGAGSRPAGGGERFAGVSIH